MASAGLRSALAAPVLLLLAGCEGPSQPPAPVAANGDAARGAVVMVRQSCGACHEIPGIQDADGLVGPPLVHFSRRTMIAGLLPNTPGNLQRWLQHPQAVTPGNGMPDLGLSDRDAEDAAAYLDKLR
jgi:cytochrome c1